MYLPIKTLKLSVSFLLVFLIGTSHPLLADEVVEGQAKMAPSELPLDEIRTFAEVFDRIRNSYVEDVEDTSLLKDAIRGMLKGLDPHSAYLAPEDFKDLQVSTSGKFGGLGIEVSTDDGYIKVIAPIDDTPADQAGILAGDIITKLDDTSVKGLGLNEAVEQMRGKPGSEIRLTIRREGQASPLEFTIKRAEIKVTSVRSALYEEQFGYLRITQFQEGTAEDVRKAITKLRTSSNEKLKGMVLDLRNNPGGVLDAAVEVSDAFLNSGLIVYTEGRITNTDMRYEATKGAIAPSTPLIVLINSGSASASEIVAGALQDHKRALILGTQSFGKGSVQTVLPLNGGHALKLTTARYFTPHGRSIQAQGIEPDIVVHPGEFKAQKDNASYKEADLQGHLENGEDQPASSDEVGEELPSAADTDYQLQQALTLLKGMSFVKPRNITLPKAAEDATNGNNLTQPSAQKMEDAAIQGNPMRLDSTGS